jgi:fumarate reductase flavoprotein subunit
VAVALVAAAGTLLPGAPGGAPETRAQARFLADRHQSAGLACRDCHADDPPRKAATDKCLACHGDEEALALKTQRPGRKANPHDSHEGALACEACHQGHRASRDRCAQCHTFGFQVP